MLSQVWAIRHDGWDPRTPESADLQPDTQATNRRVSGKSYNPATDNTRKSKFSRNKTSPYSARNGSVRWVQRENILQNVIADMDDGAGKEHFAKRSLGENGSGGY